MGAVDEYKEVQASYAKCRQRLSRCEFELIDKKAYIAELQQELADFKKAFDESDAIKQKYIEKYNVLDFDYQKLLALVEKHRNYESSVFDNLWTPYIDEIDAHINKAKGEEHD